MLLLLIVEIKNMFELLPLTWRSYQLLWKSVTWFKNWKDWDTDRQIHTIAMWSYKPSSLH